MISGVNRDRIHRNAPHDGESHAAHEHLRLPLLVIRDPIGISNGKCDDPRRSFRNKMRSVPNPVSSGERCDSHGTRDHLVDRRNANLLCTARRAQRIRDHTKEGDPHTCDMFTSANRQQATRTDEVPLKPAPKFWLCERVCCGVEGCCLRRRALQILCCGEMAPDTAQRNARTRGV